MSYQVLARKWRPQTFSELVGQQHVVDAITNALENDKLHHAYLFTGTRGVGKTTIARIFSKSLNCEQGQSANPCGKCDTCVDISDGRYVDLLEIDAASRTKVEDTRELLDNVQYRPTRGRYKVYLIDEVHMLSKHSFNALLKTLEEPPEHVKFLLATTDPQKLPVTILSRCLQFSLKALTREQIHAHLANILGQENISFEDQALLQIARAAQGSIRDSLSLTDQAIAQGNNQLSLAVVSSMLGLLDKNQILKLIKFICERDSEAALAQLEDICSQSPEYSQVLAQMLGMLHQIALTQIVPEVCKLEGSSAKGIYTLAKTLGKEQIQLLYQIGINGKRDLPHAPDGKTGLQMTVLRMLAFSPVQKIELDVDSLISDEYASLPEPTKVAAAPVVIEVQTSHVQTQDVVPPSDINKVETSTAEPEPVQNEMHSEMQRPSQQATDTRLHKQTVATTIEAMPVEPAPVQHDNIKQPPTEHAQQVPLKQEASKIGFEEDDMFAAMQNEPVDYAHDEFHQAMSEANYNDQNHFEHEAPEQSSVGRPVSAPPSNNLISSTAGEKRAYADSSSDLDKTKEWIKVANELAAQSSDGSINGKKSEADEPTTTQPLLEKEYSLGQTFPLFDQEITAFIPGDDESPQKLVSASQIDAFSAFVQATGVDAFWRQLLINANCKALTNPMILTVDKEQLHFINDELLANVAQEISQLLGQNIDIKVEVGKVHNTPNQLQARIDDMRLKHAKHLVQNDDSIQELIKAFDANVIEQSIEAR